MNYRRSIITLVFCALFHLFLVGCGQKVDAKKRLEFWTIALSPTYDDYISNLEAEFESTHPGIDVVWNDVPHQAVMQKMMASIAGGVSPDLVNLNTEYALRLASSEALVPLDDYISREEKERYFPNLWDSVTHEEKNCAFPWYVTTKVMMINRKLLEQAGFARDWHPQDWNDVYEVAQEVSAKGIGIGYFPSIKIVQDWGMSGLRVFDSDKLEPLFDTPAHAERLHWYRLMFQEGLIPEEALTEGYRGALDRYMSGSLAILEAGPQFLLKIQENAPEVYGHTEVVALPQSGDAPFPVATMNFVVPRASQNRELAIELGLFLTSPEHQQDFCELVPILPSTPASLESSVFTVSDPEDIQQQAVEVSVQQLANSKDYTLNIPLRTPLMRALNESVSRACSGKIPVEEALADCAAEWRRLLGGMK